jgi:hypothetical protein
MLINVFLDWKTVHNYRHCSGLCEVFGILQYV